MVPGTLLRSIGETFTTTPFPECVKFVCYFSKQRILFYRPDFPGTATFLFGRHSIYQTLYKKYPTICRGGKPMRQEYSIVARYGKKGKVYYVRYFRENKMIPSQWSARTDDFREAETFAKKNREKIICRYLNRKEGKVLYAVLRKYYTKNSPYLVIDFARGRKLNETSRKTLHGFIINSFIPFLRENKIRFFEDVKPVVISRFQNHLLIKKGLLPQSINRQIGGIKAIFSHLFMTGVIEQNIMKDIAPLRTGYNKIRGCYSLDALTGIFREQWKDKKSCLLCSLIYSGGLRNNEIQNLKVKDIVTREDVAFLNIVKSKTASGIRLVPLHPKVREHLNERILEMNLSAEDFIFMKHDGQRIFKTTKAANIFMGSLLGKTPAELENENISFYSGRHFYKTMLNFYNLGDIEELFMGHKVSKKVSERYNHKDKRGERELLKEARRTIEIIDRALFQ
jgi:integrase